MLALNAIEMVVLSSDSDMVAERAGGLMSRIVPDIQETAALMREIHDPLDQAQSLQAGPAFFKIGA